MSVAKLQIDLTAKCTLCCEICYSDNGNAELQAERVLSALRQHKGAALNIGGGEPFLHPAIEQIIHEAAGRIAAGSMPDYLQLVARLPSSELAAFARRLAANPSTAVSTALERYAPVWALEDALGSREFMGAVNYPVSTEGGNSFSFVRQGAGGLETAAPLSMAFVGYLSGLMKPQHISPASSFYTEYSTDSSFYFSDGTNHAEVSVISQMAGKMANGVAARGVGAAQWQRFLKMCSYPSMMIGFIQNYLALQKGKGLATDVLSLFNLDFGKVSYFLRFDSKSLALNNDGNRVERFAFSVNGAALQTVIARLRRVAAKPPLEGCIEAGTPFRKGMSSTVHCYLYMPSLMPAAHLRAIDKAVYGVNYDTSSRISCIKGLQEVTTKEVSDAIQQFNPEMLYFMSQLPKMKRAEVRRAMPAIRAELPAEFIRMMACLKPAYKSKFPLMIMLGWYK